MRATMQPRTCHVLIALQLMLALSRMPASYAAEFNINSGYDVRDLEPGNGLCVAYLIVFAPFVLPFCTLRAAIEETNALPGQDIINVPSGHFILDIDGINEDHAATGDLDIRDDLIIRGTGAGQTFLDGNGLDRVVDIIESGTEVIIQDLTIINGGLPATLTAGKGGGGVRNRGNLTLQNVVLENNRVNGSSPEDVGGGIVNMAECVLAKSTVRGNHAAAGGGLYNAPGGRLIVRSSTINNNDSLAGGGIANEGDARIINATISGNNITAGKHPFGGGLYNIAAMEILQSTITGNSSPGEGGGLSNEGSLHLINTIIAGNIGANCYMGNPPDSAGSNLVDDYSCLLDADSNIIADPGLSSLQDHGGPTRTHGLLIGSPAVDRGQDLASIGITMDQRGFKRPDGDAFDIGAFETKKRSIVPLFTPLLRIDDNP
ncbi:MAG: hypothetical protein M8357_00250 [Desulfobulbaceae bacterium]|nr:hypothetical protein [Desulfobulbaceae bacterium]